MSIWWRRLGLVYCATGKYSWATSHAYCPTPVLLDDGERLRVFCAFMDEDRIGRCGWVDVATQDPRRVLAVSDRPALDVGQPGTFDEHGVTPLSVLRLFDGTLRLYYAGWQRGIGVRYLLFTGVAESGDDGISFSRLSDAPILDRCDTELHIRSGGFVQHDEDGWHMWYAGGTGWVGSSGNARPRYDLRYVSSDDGIIWPRGGRLCFAPRDDELGFGRPSVLRRGDSYHMWYGRRSISGSYELGFAVSTDRTTWDRQDELAGLPLGAAGSWDAEMVGLSSLVTTPYGTYLFYNGNGYGATGFGVAIAEEA